MLIRTDVADRLLGMDQGRGGEVPKVVDRVSAARPAWATRGSQTGFREGPGQSVSEVVPMSPR